MPHYPSNDNDPSTTVDNVLDRNELKDTTIATTSLLGRYPTDQGRGRQTNTNPTELINDLNLAISTLKGTILTDDWASTPGAIQNFSLTTTTFATQLGSPIAEDPTIVGQYIIITSGTQAGEAHKVLHYAVTNNVVTLATALGGAPTAGDTYRLVRRVESSGWLYDFPGVSAPDLKYAANLLALKIYHVIAGAENLTFALKQLSADFHEVMLSHTLGTSLYPSGQNRGY